MIKLLTFIKRVLVTVHFLRNIIPAVWPHASQQWIKWQISSGDSQDHFAIVDYEFSKAELLAKAKMAQLSGIARQMSTDNQQPLSVDKVVN